MSADDLGDRMKEYESCNRLTLPDNLPVVVRIDGNKFSTWTRGFEKPFDIRFINIMNEVAKFTIEKMQNARFAFVQSDEISFIMYKKNFRAQPWFGNGVQKMASIASSIATAKLNSMECCKDRPAWFDGRCFVLPRNEVKNYCLWRQRDWERNSIQMLARSMYSQKQLQNKNISDLNEMIFQKGQNWNDLPTYLKRGRCIVRVDEEFTTNGNKFTRSVWKVDNDIPIFTENPEYIESKMLQDEEQKI